MTGVLLFIAIAAVLSVVAQFVIHPMLDRAFRNRQSQTDDELGSMDDQDVA